MFLDGAKALNTPVTQTFWRRRPGVAVPSPSAAQPPRATPRGPVAGGNAISYFESAQRRRNRNPCSASCRHVVQLVEQMIRNQQVRGSRGMSQ